MSETKRHAMEPWRLGGDGKSGQLLSAKGGVIANWGAGGIDARRIVACVNACKDLGTEALESGALEKALDALASVEWADNSGDEYRSECPWCKAEGPVAPGWVSHKETPRGGVHTEGCTRQSALRALGRLL